MPLLSQSQFSDLVACIYDCALDAALWPSVLERLAHSIDAVHGAVRVVDPRTRHLRLNINWGSEARWTDLYNSTYFALVPTLPNQLDAELDVPLTSSQLMERTQFCATRFYKEWARPQGYEDVVGVQFLRQADRVAYNSFYFASVLGPTADDTRETLSMLAPHLRRAALIGDLLELRTIEAEQFRSVVDQLAIGVLLVDRELRLLHANRCGEELLDAGQPLRLAQERVRAFDPRINVALREIIQQLDRDGTSISRAGTCIPAHFADGRPAVMHVLPQRTGSQRARLDRAATAALFIAPQTGGPPTWRDAMAALYDLTQAEQRVLTLVVEGLSTEQITDRLNIGVPTLKTHLLRLFSKTGTARRGELITLAREFTLPVRGS